MHKPPGWTFLTIAHGNMPAMDEKPSRGTLARNLRRLIEADLKPGERYSVRAWALGKGLDVRLIDRMTKGSNSVTLDKLQAVADACGLKPWHLLVEDLDPREIPDAPISHDERQMLRRLRRLLDEDQA